LSQFFIWMLIPDVIGFCHGEWFPVCLSWYPLAWFWMFKIAVRLWIAIVDGDFGMSTRFLLECSPATVCIRDCPAMVFVPWFWLDLLKFLVLSCCFCSLLHCVSFSFSVMQ
jgi:hypothetical protein